LNRDEFEQLDARPADQASGPRTSYDACGEGEPEADEQKDQQPYFEPGKLLVAPGHTYEVTGLLGEGGMGKVWAGFDRDTYGEVAIKVLNVEHARERGSIYRRFCHEARIPGLVSNRIKNSSTRVASKYLLKVPAIGELIPDGTPYYTMTRLSGCTLQAQIKGASERAQRYGLEPGLRLDTALNIVNGLLVSLVAIHQCGVVHRDVKPANIFLHKVPGEPAAVILLDYGIAHLMDEGPRTVVAGSQGYIAPEHFTREIGPPADIFAVGVLLFMMLAGVKPSSCFNNSPWPSPGETREAPSLVPFNVVPALVDLIARCLALDPRKRPTAIELSMQVQEILNTLEPVDVGTAVTEDDPIDRTAAESSTGISVAECEPATSPDLEVTARMQALRVENERRARFGMPPLTRLPNNSTEPIRRPVLPLPGAALITVPGRRQQHTVPMGAAVVLRPPPKPLAEEVTMPPVSSSPSPEAFGPVSLPEYSPESMPPASASAMRRNDAIISSLPEQSRLAEALQRVVETRHVSSNGGSASAPSLPPTTATTSTALARTPRAEPRRLEAFFAAIRARLAVRRERATRYQAEKAAAHAARLEAQQIAQALTAQERSESELADKQRQVEQNRRLRREAEARGESWTEPHQPRQFASWRLPVAVFVLALCSGLVGLFIVRRNAIRAEAVAPSGAPSALVASVAAVPGNEGTEFSVTPSAVASVASVAPSAADASAVASSKALPRARPSPVRTPAGSATAIKASPTPTRDLHLQINFE